MYLYGEAIRFDAFKHKKEILNDYADEIFLEIKSSLIQNPPSPIETNGFIEMPRIEEFLERDGLMEHIEMILNNKKKLCLFGYPGVGKTSCAVELAYRLMEKHNQKIIWINSEDQTKIFNKVSDFMNKIGENEKDIEIMKTKFINYVNNQKYWLIFDNLENIDDLKNIFKLETIKTIFLITTRLDNRIRNIDMIEIVPFKIEEAEQFLKNALPQLPINSIQKIISEYASNQQLLPCKLSMIAGVLNENHEKTVEEVLIECRHGGYAVKIIDELLFAESKDSIKILMIATLIDPDYISFELLKQLKWEKPIKDAIQKLSNFNLLTRVYSNSPKYGIKMHRIFIKDFKEYFESENKRNLKIDNQIKEEILEKVTKSLDCITNDPSTHLKETNHLILHAVKILEENEINSTLIASELFEKVGQYLENEIHDYTKALKYIKTGCQIKITSINQNDSSLAKSFERQARIYKKIGDGQQSLEYNKKALEMREKLYSGNHPDIAQSLNDLAISYSRLGDDDKFFEYTKKALDMREKLYSGNHPDIAQSLNDLAVSYGRLGDANKSLEYTKKALEMQEKLYSGNHPDIARSLNSLAVSYSRLGNERMAYDYFKKALNMRQFLFDDGHPDLKESIENLAGSSKRLGKK